MKRKQLLAVQCRYYVALPHAVVFIAFSYASLVIGGVSVCLTVCPFVRHTLVMR